MAIVGVVQDPYSVPAWEAATGFRADMCMLFEAWSNQRPLTTQLAEAKALGHRGVMVTWEPWEPAATDSPDSRYQETYSLESILAGAHNDYIDLFARALRDSGLTVYLRWAHEMNGDWYPWSYNPALYRTVWMYLRDRIRFSRKATNVRFVWAPNADLWADHPRFLTGVLPYWPPARYVDDVGLTVIQRDDKDYTPDLIERRVRLVTDVFAKPVWACEVACVLDRAVSWFDGLAGITGRDGPFAGMVLNQSGTRSPTEGLDWSIVDYPEERDAWGRVTTALHFY